MMAKLQNQAVHVILIDVYLVHFFYYIYEITMQIWYFVIYLYFL